MEQATTERPAALAPTVIPWPSTRAVARVVAVTVGALLLLGVVALCIEMSIGDFPGREEIVVLLSLDSEYNLPTVASVLGLAACALLLALIAATQRSRSGPHVRRWTLLAAIFLYLAVDEGARIHERLNGPLSALPITTGYLRWGWVLVGGLAAALLAVAYRRFLFHLPHRHRVGIVVAACSYVGGALVLEAVGAKIAGESGLSSASYLILTVGEEAMELTGIGVFLVVLWSLLSLWNPTLAITRSHRPET